MNQAPTARAATTSENGKGKGMKPEGIATITIGSVVLAGLATVGIAKGIY